MGPAVVRDPAEPEAPSQPRWEVADVFRQYGEAYRATHALPLSHLKVMRAVESCRTGELGGHLEQCDACGFERPAYNSCRNRHCPKCQTLAKVQWLQARQAELLPVAYFHNVFTLPHELNPVALCNKRVVFDLLFQSVAQTLLAFGQNNLGGKVGFTAILHTWDQTLRDHFHLHCVIPSGALSSDRERWTPTRKGYLFNVEALSQVFRGKFIDGLERAFEASALVFPGQTVTTGTPGGFRRLIRSLWAKNWVVYSKRPFGGPEQVLDYLGRYTHRIAISNHRLLVVANGQVRFHYRDRQDGDKLKPKTLLAHEFIRRFLLHVLPKGFHHIRHFGFSANRCKAQDLPQCRQLLGLCPDRPLPTPKTVREWMLELTGTDISRCPRCASGSMKPIRELPPGWARAFTPVAREPPGSAA